MIENKVKLVIWDLDETFWGGTLLEGGIAPIASNVELVKALTSRGIVNSICSKNDYEQVKAKLTQLEIWDYFVFPHLRFSPKGQAIAEMLEAAGLRAENTLFIDDNPSNLEEVRYFNPGIMAAHPAEVLKVLLDHPNCAGKHDPDLTRLKQYQFLQRKVKERTISALSNEEFLRTANVRVTIDRDNVDANFDRVVELINRTNQLNYTKRRLSTPEEIADFKALLQRFGHQAGCIRAKDNYGDYGLIGFFLMKRRPNATRLIHFVFSCRTMNMGIEQYIYEMLGKPDINIEQPVSYGLETHPAVDWINAREAGGSEGSIAKSWKLVLLGGCDLLQLANHCSTDRLEFVNRMRGDVKVRYDDPGFILSDRAQVKAHDSLLPVWNYADTVQFDEGIASSRLILLCMGAAMNGQYFRIRDAVTVRMPKTWSSHVQSKDPTWFHENFQELELGQDERLRLILNSFDAVAGRCSKDAYVFVIGTYTKGLKENNSNRRTNINAVYEEHCRGNARFHYLDMDSILHPKHLVDNRHFSPLGYHLLAQHVLNVASGLGLTPSDATPLPALAG